MQIPKKSTSDAEKSSTPRDGSQTLARGINALLMVVESRNGLSVTEVAKKLGVHRSIAYRLLQTLTDSGLINRSSDGVYLPGAKLTALSNAYLPTLINTAKPVMSKIADELEATVILFVEQNSSALAVASSEPIDTTSYLSFKIGTSVGIENTATGHALLAAKAPRHDDKKPILETRERGYAVSFGELAPETYEVSAWIKSELMPYATISVITHIKNTAENTGAKLVAAAESISKRLRQ